MAELSVKAPQLRADAHLLPQCAGEHAPFHRQVEAGELAARVDTAARLSAARDDDAVAGGEADELALRRAPAAAGAMPQRNGYEGSSSGCSTGIPAGTSSGSRSAETTSSTSTSSTSSSSSASVSAGGPAT